MRKLVRGVAIAGLCGVLGACGTPVGNYIGTGVDNFETFVTSPKTAATLVVLKQATTVVLCDISAVAQVTQAVGAAVNADQSFLGTTGKVYAGSSVACQGIGGLNLGSVAAPSGSTVVQ